MAGAICYPSLLLRLLRPLPSSRSADRSVRYPTSLSPNVEARDLSEFELTSPTLALKLEQSRWPQIVRGRTRH
jgi:hypothetical protein